MARPSVILSTTVAMVLGILIGIVGMLALIPALNPSAGTVSNQPQQGQAGPQLYGTR
jgi:hypothetical protein